MSYFNNSKESDIYHYTLLKNEDIIDDFITNNNESKIISIKITASSVTTKTDKPKYQSDDTEFHHKIDEPLKSMDKCFESYGYDSLTEWWMTSGIRKKYAGDMNLSK
jgi:hypothetical protein